jgi:hypothetical protein
VRRARRRRRLYTLIAGLVALALAIVLIVDGGDDDGSGGAKVDARAAVATVQAFQKAIADRDYATICNRLFTTDAREASGGGNCQSVLAQNASRLRKPDVQITSVVLRGNSATVGVVAQVQGGPKLSDVIRLVREKQDYRISSAGPASGSGQG